MGARLAVLIPLGPDRPADDTLESVQHYCAPELVVVTNDSGRPLDIPGVEVVDTGGSSGLRGGLYRSISLGMRQALKVPWDLLLRIDTDALVINRGWEELAAERFAANPQLGVLGN